ncbi:hypothetical protein F4553_007074 [Allocatelliglobosispora scoriae]|uniref:Uncharacterized protein n=1 Tax=Allocatelliglobosispora scoriae TaxID=643052 RepID=A0A841C3U9_9ACTN|nr:hypothetical protein [Allocatelliglobosispora scoriae]MBB5873640.1 hypothetical protein [Allocatelliglobosispora scoriae]
MSSISCRRPAHQGRDRSWSGLPHEATDPTSYFSAITPCSALEGEPGGLVRENVVDGSIRQREPDEFHPPSRIIINFMGESSPYAIVGADGIAATSGTDLGEPR